jgi:hypothetical protein
MKDSRLILFFIIFGIISIPIRHQIVSEEIIDEKSYVDTTHFLLPSSPACLKMFTSIEKNAIKYRVPIRYALGIAYAETRYQGPFHWNYDPIQRSGAGALGPMQIIPSTADMMWNKKISREKLLSDIDFNVETSMKLLSSLHKKYKDWKIVFGCYNTGRPIVNDYAEKVYNF